MEKRAILVMVALLTASMIIGCGREAREPEAVETYAAYTDPEQVIDIGINEGFFIILEGGDYTEGLEWEAKYDTTMLRLVESWSAVEKANAAQAFATVWWFKFKPLWTGETKIIMLYVQWSMRNRQELDQRIFMVNIK